MAIIGIRELNRDTRGVIERLLESREPVVLTRQGTPIATIHPLDQQRVNDLVISSASEFVGSVRQAEREFAAGETVPLAEARRARGARRRTQTQGPGEGEAEGAPSGEQTQTEAESELAAKVKLLTEGAAVAVGGAVGAGAMGAGASYAVTAYRRAAAERVKRLSQSIVDVATEQGLFEQGATTTAGEPEFMEEIADANARLYGWAYCVEATRRAMEETIERIGEASEREAPGHAASVETELEPEELASGQVWEFNQRLLECQRQLGSASLGDYAQALRASADAVEAAGAGATAIPELLKE